jgi:hypothetical protein
MSFISILVVKSQIRHRWVIRSVLRGNDVCFQYLIEMGCWFKSTFLTQTHAVGLGFVEKKNLLAGTARSVIAWLISNFNFDMLYFLTSFVFF